jgi:Lrp/AsnC family leucine-responsive transcriptional regulator
MDDIDLKILDILQTDGRASHEEMGRRLNLSRPTIHQRVRKLEADGVIKRYRAMIDWRKLGQAISALIYVKFNSGNCEETAQRILDIRVPRTDVEEGYRVAGEWCVVFKVRSDTPQNVSKFLDALWMVQGVAETSTIFILSTLYE